MDECIGEEYVFVFRLFCAFAQNIPNFSGASNKSGAGAFRKKGIVFEIITS